MVLVFAASLMLPRVGLAQLTLPAIALVVGLHFLPLARIFAGPHYYWTAAALTALSAAVSGAVAAKLVGISGANVLISAGAALILWTTAVGLLLTAASVATRADGSQLR